MWKRASTTPGHREHEMQWHAQGLRAVNVSEAWRVGDDCVCDEWFVGLGIGSNARVPTAVKQFGNHGSFALDFSLPKTLHGRDETGVLDHIRHEFLGIASDGEKFKIGVSNKGVENIVSCETNAMSVFL